MQGGCKIKPLTDEVRAAYDAPFPDESYKAGARAFPTLVPITPDDPSSQANVEAWKSLRKFNKPFLTAFSDSDPVTAGGEKYFAWQGYSFQLSGNNQDVQERYSAILLYAAMRALFLVDELTIHKQLPCFHRLREPFQKQEHRYFPTIYCACHSLTISDEEVQKLCFYLLYR